MLPPLISILIASHNRCEKTPCTLADQRELRRRVRTCASARRCGQYRNGALADARSLNAAGALLISQAGILLLCGQGSTGQDSGLAVAGGRRSDAAPHCLGSHNCHVRRLAALQPSAWLPRRCLGCFGRYGRALHDHCLLGHRRGYLSEFGGLQRGRPDLAVANEQLVRVAASAPRRSGLAVRPSLRLRVPLRGRRRAPSGLATQLVRAGHATSGPRRPGEPHWTVRLGLARSRSRNRCRVQAAALRSAGGSDALPTLFRTGRDPRAADCLCTSAQAASAL